MSVKSYIITEKQLTDLTMWLALLKPAEPVEAYDRIKDITGEVSANQENRTHDNDEWRQVWDEKRRRYRYKWQYDSIREAEKEIIWLQGQKEWKQNH